MADVEIRAITVRLPWAALIAENLKRVETRSQSWGQTSYRGWLAIHASLKFGEEERAFMRTNRACRLLSPHAKQLHRGKFLALAYLYDVLPLDDLKVSRRERSLGNFDEGRFGLMLKDVHCIEHPFAAKGQLGLWRPMWTDLRRLRALL